MLVLVDGLIDVEDEEGGRGGLDHSRQLTDTTEDTDLAGGKVIRIELKQGSRHSTLRREGTRDQEEEEGKGEGDGVGNGERCGVSESHPERRKEKTRRTPS